jgi:hypothetical protein
MQGGVGVGATRTTATCPSSAGPRHDVEVRPRTNAALQVSDNVRDPCRRLIGEFDAANSPRLLWQPAGNAFGPEDEIPALMAIGETADLSTNLALVELRAFRLPEQRLVIRVLEERLNVLESQVAPRWSEDRHLAKRITAFARPVSARAELAALAGGQPTLQSP